MYVIVHWKIQKGPGVSIVGIISIKMLIYLIDMGLYFLFLSVFSLKWLPFHLKFQIYYHNVHEILLWELIVLKLLLKCWSGSSNGDIKYLFSLDFSLNSTLLRENIFIISVCPLVFVKTYFIVQRKINLWTVPYELLWTCYLAFFGVILNMHPLDQFC